MGRTLGDATCREQPALCSDGICIWYDSLVGLFEARLADRDRRDLEAAWLSLLESAALDEYANVSLVGRWMFNE